ncbi:MAG: von Willebrand factor type A domain-containing protein, partial [Erysipelotrichaceae bacterium]|nr:von Willebrand factor type A domain-containing protein [Erysipelotrichaceae bacterium]
ASYAQLRAMILRGEKVPADAVRVEEMLNYFRYDYPVPEDGHHSQRVPGSRHERSVSCLSYIQREQY